MKQVTITVADDEQAQHITEALSVAEEDGTLDFPFNTSVGDAQSLPNLTSRVETFLAKVDLIDGSFTGRLDPIISAAYAHELIQSACREYLK
jgi:hypothetical protein